MAPIAINRVVETLHSHIAQLTCEECGFLIQDPVQCPQLHLFCKKCLTESVTRRGTCPHIECKSAAKVINLCDIKPAPLIIRKILSHVNITCKWKSRGCQISRTISVLSKHQRVCSYRKAHDHTCQTSSDITSISVIELEKLKAEIASLNAEKYRLRRKLATCPCKRLNVNNLNLPQSNASSDNSTSSSESFVSQNESEPN
jgi:hypothetical protein